MRKQHGHLHGSQGYSSLLNRKQGNVFLHCREGNAEMTVSKEPMAVHSICSSCFCSLSFIFNCSVPVCLGKTKKKNCSWRNRSKTIVSKVQNANQTWYVTSVEFGVPSHQLFCTPGVYPEPLDVDSRVQIAHQELSVKGDWALGMFVY